MEVREQFRAAGDRGLGMLGTQHVSSQLRAFFRHLYGLFCLTGGDEVRDQAVLAEESIGGVLVS